VTDRTCPRCAQMGPSDDCLVCELLRQFPGAVVVAVIPAPAPPRRRPSILQPVLATRAIVAGRTGGWSNEPGAGRAAAAHP
jgi:hypothetical protein